MTAQTYEQLLAAAPPAPDTTGVRARVAARNDVTGRRIVVLDDDPTGSQSVHGAQVVLALEDTERALAEPGAATFLLTNTRSLDPHDAGALNERLGRELARTVGPERLTLVSRSDSTLRGHLLVEVAALDRALRSVTGRGFDAVLVVPAYLEAGRATVGDVHWARVDGVMVPVADTEFARDATFGYRSSNLREWIAETSHGTVHQGDVWSLSLRDIRLGGPDRVQEVLRAARDGRHVVVNATDYADLDIVAAGLLGAQEDGARVVVRSGPSMVKAIAGVPDRGPLEPGEIRSSVGAGGVA